MGGLENKDQTKRVCLRHGKRRKLPVVQPGIPHLVEAGHVDAFLRACLFAQVAQVDRFHHRMPTRRNVALDGAEEGGVAKHTAQGVNGEGAAFVDAVVEHQVRARVGKQQVLGEAGQNVVVVAGRDGCMHPMRVLAP